MSPSQRTDIPRYQDLIYPVLKAADAQGGSAQTRDHDQVIDETGTSDDVDKTASSTASMPNGASGLDHRGSWSAERIPPNLRAPDEHSHLARGPQARVEITSRWRLPAR